MQCCSFHKSFGNRSVRIWNFCMTNQNIKMRFFGTISHNNLSATNHLNSCDNNRRSFTRHFQSKNRGQNLFHSDYFQFHPTFSDSPSLFDHFWVWLHQNSCLYPAFSTRSMVFFLDFYGFFIQKQPFSFFQCDFFCICIF